MPDTAPSTLIHYSITATTGGSARCGSLDGAVTAAPGLVTCFSCRRTTVFLQAQSQQGVGGSTPPVKLSGVMAAAPELQTLHRAGLAYIVKRGLNSGTNDGEHEALTELADALGLVYDDDTESYT